jgi:hypothetical protein
MPRTTYLGRPAVSIENEHLRITVTEEGGHIAEIYSKAADINPLWVPNWPTEDPSQFRAEREQLFGNRIDGMLLTGILGHNTCLDLFGGPSEGEAAAGMTAHGEAAVLRYELTEDGNLLTCRVHMPLAQLVFTRTIKLQGQDALVHETVENLAAFDRPLAWTQHVTLSPPYLDPKTTEFRIAAAGPSIVSFVDLGNAPYLRNGETFTYPQAPRIGGGTIGVEQMNPNTPASSYTALTMQPMASWTAWSPVYKFALSYVWRGEDFPWLGIWEENCSRPHSPWFNQAVTRGLEFGTSPFPESRREMVERGRMLDTPTYKWLPGAGKLEARYWIRTAMSDSIPEGVTEL